MKKYILTLILALASLGLYAQTNRNKTIINAALHTRLFIKDITKFLVK